MFLLLYNHYYYYYCYSISAGRQIGRGREAASRKAAGGTLIFVCCLLMMSVVVSGCDLVIEPFVVFFVMYFCQGHSKTLASVRGGEGKC